MSAPAKGDPSSYFPAIEKKYGRPVQEWIDLIGSSPLTRHMELVGWLKQSLIAGTLRSTGVVFHLHYQRGEEEPVDIAGEEWKQLWAQGNQDARDTAEAMTRAPVNHSN